MKNKLSKAILKGINMKILRSKLDIYQIKL